MKHQGLAEEAQEQIEAADVLCCAAGLAVRRGGRSGTGGANALQGADEEVFEFYLDDPAAISNALFWVRSVFNTLQQSPYDVSPEDVQAVVVLHGVEIAATVTRNQDKYREAVERMRYDAQMGVKFKVCSQAVHDFGYTPADFQDFIDVVPNARTELIYWPRRVMP